MLRKLSNVVIASIAKQSHAIVRMRIASKDYVSLAMTLIWAVIILGGTGCNRKLKESNVAALENTPAYGDTYIEASIGDASHLNPVLASDSASADINALVFNGLVKYDKDLNLVGDLAGSWKISKNGREITFHLRPGVKWHDGRPLSSQDVKFTYERLKDPNVRTPFSSDFMLVEKVETLDPLTIKVTYKEPFAPALESWGIGIIPEHIFSNGDFNSHPANRNPIGTGPYRFVAWKTDEKIILQANPDYFEGKPYIGRYIYRIIPDQAVQFLELRQEGIDSMGLTPDQYLAYPEFFRNYNKFRYPSFSYSYLGFNLNNKLFSDLRTRQAIAHAMDKNKIIQGALLGFGLPATGPYPPSSWAYDSAVSDYEFDPDKARKMLAEDGWRDSDNDSWLDRNGQRFEFTLLTNQGNKVRELSCQIVQSELARVGIKVNIRILEWSTFINNFINKRDFEAVLLGWNLGRDPDQYGIWHSGETGEGKYNFVGYTNPVVDELLNKGRRVFDKEERRKIYNEFHRILARDLPYIFLYYPEALPVIHKRIYGPEVAKAGIGWNFREWYVSEPLQRYRLQQ